MSDNQTSSGLGLLRPRISQLALPALLAAMGLSSTALATEWEFKDFTFTLNNRLSVGAAWRMEDRDPNLVGKLNNNPALCEGDDCVSFGGDPAPNQRLVEAPGGFFAHNQDNGNLNYDKYDIVSGNAKMFSDLTVNWKDVIVKLRGYGLYDNVNTNAIDRHPDTRFQPAFTDRRHEVEQLGGERLMILDAFVTVPFELFGKSFTVSGGQQRIRWGESNLIALNSISEINPPDQNLLYLPGGQISEIFQPVGVVSLSTQVTETLAIEAIYQYEWKRVRPAGSGTFLSENDIAGGGEYAVLSLGQTSEDPNGIGSLQGIPGLISSTATSVQIESQDFGFPDNGGQYGVRLSGYSEALNGGTEYGVYFLNYHSRLPYGSVFATDESCLRDALTGVDAIALCQGFAGTANPTGLGREPIPFDTLRVFLDYPEDIQLYGISFNTNIGDWSLAGEYSYRPNLPVQVSLPDVLYAGVAPALPRRDLSLVLGTVPSARRFGPDFIETIHRGNADIQPNQYIPGYERLKVGQGDFTAIKSVSSSNPFKADQIIIIVEPGFTHVIDMPGLERVQFDGGGANQTHASPGADGTGANGVVDASRFTPTQQTKGFADDFAWGYRILARFEYNSLIENMVVRPTFIFGHDVQGVSITPMQNFIEDRIQFQAGTEVELTQQLTFFGFYQGYTGGGDLNKLHDRDFMSIMLAYSF